MLNLLSGDAPKQWQQLARLLVQLSDYEEIERVRREYEKYFPSETIEDMPEQYGEEITRNVLDTDGDLGVGDFQYLQTAAICQLLAIPTTTVKKKIEDEDGGTRFEEVPDIHFPFFHLYESEFGTPPDPDKVPDHKRWVSYTAEQEEQAREEDHLLPLRPRWHQYVGLAACVKAFLLGKNVLLADGIGVGKTMECMMIMAYLRHLAGSQARDKEISIPLGTCN